MKRVLSELGGWPVVDRDWSPVSSSWTVEKMLAQLRGPMNTVVLIKCLVDVDDKNSSQRVIQVVLVCITHKDRKHHCEQIEQQCEQIELQCEQIELRCNTVGRLGMSSKRNFFLFDIKKVSF